MDDTAKQQGVPVQAERKQAAAQEARSCAQKAGEAQDNAARAWSRLEGCAHDVAKAQAAYDAAQARYDAECKVATSLAADAAWERQRARDAEAALQRIQHEA